MSASSCCYPRYGELFDARNGQKNSGARGMFSAQELRDVQMWSQLAWFDEEFQSGDAEVRAWKIAVLANANVNGAAAWVFAVSRSAA